MEAFSQRKLKGRVILRQLHKDTHTLLTRRRSAANRKAHPEVLMGPSQPADTTATLTRVPTAFDPLLQKLLISQEVFYHFACYFQTWRQDKEICLYK